VVGPPRPLGCHQTEARSRQLRRCAGEASATGCLKEKKHRRGVEQMARGGVYCPHPALGFHQRRSYHWSCQSCRRRPAVVRSHDTLTA
jgi:hypothetical protein